MKPNRSYSLGIMFRREYAPETLPSFAQQAEASGFDELWVVEDCLFGGGIAAAAVALACTQTIKVGLGIMPAPVRNPVFAAMEIATLARLYPGRLLPGFGHGVTEWMHQVGAMPDSQLKALEEVTLSVRRLLSGERFSFQGQYVQLDQVQLVHPPEQIPPIVLGVIGPKSLALSGRIADGTILSEYAAPEYIDWAHERIIRGQREAAHEREHRLTLFAYACADTSAMVARQRIRPLLAGAMASGDIDPKLAAMGILPEVQDYRQAGGQAILEARMPDSWIDQMSIAGTAEDWMLAIERFVKSGIHSIVLVPLPDSDSDEIHLFARHCPKTHSIV